MTRARLGLGCELVALALAGLTVLWGPLAQGSTPWWGQAGLTLLGLATTAVTVLALTLRGKLRTPHLAWLLIATAFIAWVWISTLWAPYKLEGYRWAGVWTAVLGVALTLHLLVTTRARQTVALSALVLAAALSLGLAYLQTRGFLVPGFNYYPGAGPGLVTGPYFNPSHFSGYLIGVAALLTSLLLFTRLHLHSVFLLGLLVLLHWVNLKTDASSIPAVLLATLTPLGVWVWSKNRRVGRMLMILSIVAAVTGISVFLSPRGQAFFAENRHLIGLNNTWDGFLQGRQVVWRYGFEMWRDHPFEGAGSGQFLNESPHYRASAREPRKIAEGMSVNYAHNDVLQIGSELGAVGVFLFLGLLVLPLWTHRSGLGTLIWYAALPPLLVSSIYDAHLSVIPGTMITAFALLALATVQTSGSRTAEKAPLETEVAPELEGSALSGITS